MDNDLELQEYKMNCLRDQQHQDKINKLCKSKKSKHNNYMRECVIAGKLIEYKTYKIKNEDIDFV